MGTTYKNPQAEGAAAAKSEAAYDLKDLFEVGLNDIYSAEKALIETLPQMVENASSPQLANTLQNHLNETKQHVSRLEEIFESKGIKAVAKKSEAIEGLIEESKGIIAQAETGAMRDASIIAAGQKLKKYEIATYDALHSFAENLGENKAANLLAMTLNEQKKADAALNEIAQSNINFNASEQI
ncbi:ferritin-like domain-containing protein [Flavobacterium sp. ZT3R17]|uniref:YciE/YciF ferroxidase family protein n=1 Tax=Flavobacterium cryoconiti TaxID=3398736 RepID=UPI003A8C7435